MEYDSRYLLVCDDCEDCNYISNAFTLQGLPLKALTVTNIIESDDQLNDIAAIIMCKNVDEANGTRLYQKSSETNAHFITLNPKSELINIGSSRVHPLSAPFTLNQLNRILAETSAHETDDHFDNQTEKHPIFSRLIGQSTHVRKIREMIKQVAYSDSTVLILGQSGTGKDVIASCIHHLSSRKNNAFVPINCGAIPSELMESELFGHEKGAFTGALSKRAGRFEIANNGTLFLDEIGDMPLPMQVKLLRVIQERTIDRVGGNASLKVDVRLIAATNKNLEELIQQNKFREDLFYRLNVFPIKVPTLAERKDDIATLIDFHLDRIYDRLKHRVVFTDIAKEILSNYSWPGNIRELENFLERMVILHRDKVVTEAEIDAQYKQKKLAPSLISPSIETTDNTLFNFKEYIANAERQLIEFALEQSNGMIQSAADYLSLGKTTLLDKMKKYNIISTN